jgi:hypothetical protein
MCNITRRSVRPHACRHHFVAWMCASCREWMDNRITCPWHGDDDDDDDMPDHTEDCSLITEDVSYGD